MAKDEEFLEIVSIIGYIIEKIEKSIERAEFRQK
jgi:hypothetical protein